MARYRHKATGQIENIDPKSAWGKTVVSSPSWISLDPKSEVKAKPKRVKTEKKKIDSKE